MWRELKKTAYGGRHVVCITEGGGWDTMIEEIRHSWKTVTLYRKVEV